MKTTFEEKPFSWEDVEDILKNTTPSGTDDEKLAYFKSKIIGHLNNLQAEEDKKIIPFPNKNKKVL